MKKFLLCVSSLLCAVLFTGGRLFAADADIASLARQVSEAKEETLLRQGLAQLSTVYLKEHKYNEFVEFLQLQRSRKKPFEALLMYYLADARYQQLKYLEETQNWDEYFSKGNDYRSDIEKGIEASVASFALDDPLRIRGRILAFNFHKGQEDAFAESALSDLMKDVEAYSQAAHVPALLKEVADALAQSEQKAASRRIYKLYFEQLAASEDIAPEQLKTMADNFLVSGNPDLAEPVYGIFIEKMLTTSPKEEALKSLFEVARIFSAAGGRTEGAYFAEELFKKAEELGGKDIFDQELIYLRALNLEKVKEYARCNDFYQQIATRFPSGTRASEALFKSAIINTYILADLMKGKEYFEALSRQAPVNAHVVSSLYHLGLLSQWEGDPERARFYYTKVLESASKDNFSETAALAAERLKEIDSGAPLEHNLKVFLDASLGTPRSAFNAGALELSASPFTLKQGQNTRIATGSPSMETGCMQVQVQYLWSGHLGDASVGIEQASFTTAYKHAGTKEINLVVVSASGVVDRSLFMADVY